jgi:hypothetical protein
MALGAAMLVAGGCETMTDTTAAVRERWAARHAGQVREYATPPRAAYDLLRRAAEQMGYRFLRGGPAQGIFEAISSVRAGETHGSARQLRLQATLRPTGDGTGTQVTARLTEVLEADSSNRAGQAVEVPLRDTPQYQVLFDRIGELLAAENRTTTGQKSR